METFDAFQNPDGDVQLQLESWLKACVGKFETDQPNWLNVLRCVNQGIVFPAVFHMKKMFTEKFAYKDLKGSWKVRISILGRDMVEIQHRKGEKSQQTGPQDNFTFTWSILFRLDLATADLDVSVSILDYIFDKDMDKTNRGELLAAMQPFLSGSAPYLAIWRKPLRKLPVSRDFGRLCARLSIFNHLGRPIHTRSVEDTATSLIRKVMLTLAECFNPELVPGLEESFDLRFREEGEPMEQLTKVLHEDKVVPEDSHLAAVLKCINTTIVFPAVDFLHTRIYEKMRYKDVRGTWATHITLGPAMRSGSSAAGLNTSSSLLSGSGISSSPSNMSHALLGPGGTRSDDYIFSGSPASESSHADSVDQTGEIPRYRYVSVLHRKMEQAYSPDPKEQFQFEWIVEFVLNRELTIKEVHMGVVDFSFGPQTSDETKSHVLSCLKPFLRPSAFQTQAAAVPAHDLIDIAIKKLEEAEVLAKTLLSAYHPNMPHSIDLRSLLLALRSSVPNSEVRLPSADSSKPSTGDKIPPSSSSGSMPSSPSGKIRHSVSSGALLTGGNTSHSVHYAPAGSRLSASIESPPGSTELPHSRAPRSSHSSDLETLPESASSPPNSRKSSPFTKLRDVIKSPRSSTSSNSSSTSTASAIRHQSERPSSKQSPRGDNGQGKSSPRDSISPRGSSASITPVTTSSPKSPRSKKKEISSPGSTRSSSPSRKRSTSKGRVSGGSTDLPPPLPLSSVTSDSSSLSPRSHMVPIPASPPTSGSLDTPFHLELPPRRSPSPGIPGSMSPPTDSPVSASSTDAAQTASTATAATSFSDSSSTAPSDAHSTGTQPSAPSSIAAPPSTNGLPAPPLSLTSPRIRRAVLDPPSQPESPVTPKPVSVTMGKSISKTLRTPSQLPPHIAASLPSNVPPPLAAAAAAQPDPPSEGED